MMPRSANLHRLAPLLAGFRVLQIMEFLKKDAHVILECLMLIDVQNTTISQAYEIPEWNIHFQ